ncbi:hypothetical protein KO528_14835 [Saccharophagus degradans]|uniref:Uncharacterized protein n=1 Tax=Saccharophagus degradans TaxID=86304 RepID=A0AAW7XDV8_9GAMM|nr:hypothetical protein [Saccharophagus degradans]MBU2986637.1 hypothetical protein [Saccharophagus degradans]MDO6424751.1 hypothetical protein [Saccharophagus degradans]MDO6609497.1 hypothetical protein [Saccharophagus degradans]
MKCNTIFYAAFIMLGAISIGVNVSEAYEYKNDSPVDTTAKENNTVLMDELQWILAVPKEKWVKPLVSIAVLMEQGDYARADKQLDEWLSSDFEVAVSALAVMRQFPFYFSEHSLAPIYARHLQLLGGREAMEVLAVLDFSNPAVSHVGFQVMSDWWNKNPHQMANWIAATPGFFEDLYTEEFLYLAATNNESFRSLASIYFALKSNDPRRTKIYVQLIERWMELDAEEAMHFVREKFDEIYVRNSSVLADPAIDRTLLRVGYEFSNHNQYAQALEWLSRIKDVETRDLGVRDFAYALGDESGISIFRRWLREYPVQEDAVAMDIEQHFQALSNINNNH